jgi:polysaccharide deacetylase family protein (PEP-CTERM system associated)
VTGKAINLTHCLTFEIEEHFQVSAFDSPMRRRHWNQIKSRVEGSTEKLLELLAMRDVRATFFVLGWVAERHPALIRNIAQDGHEVASHGYAHELITAQTPKRFREDVRRAKGILEDLTGEPVLGYRAPRYTITPETIWVHPILVEEGYAYDSSLFTILDDRYGLAGANPLCHRLSTNAGPLWVIPPSTVTIAGVRMQIGGGEALRFFPYRVSRQLLKNVEATGQPLVVCLHAWELDPDQPRMNGARLSRLRHYFNLHKTEGRLNRLLREFRFAPIREVIAPIQELNRESIGESLGDWSVGQDKVAEAAVGGFRKGKTP